MSLAYSRVPRSDVIVAAQRPYQGSIEDHLKLLIDIEVTSTKLIQKPALQETGIPTLLHPDLHKRNIFVSKEDPSKITCIIDWQSTSIEPAFIYANETPDFAEMPVDYISTDSPDQKLSDEGPAKSKAKEDVERCAKAFEVCIFGYVDILGRARAIDQTILRPFRHCTSMWRDGVPAARSDMIDLFKAWKDLGLPGSCPYQPTEEEIAAHEKQYEDFKASHSLKTWLSRTFEIGSDGWVPIYDWDRILPLYREAYQMWMESARESEAEGDSDMTQEKADRLWPFDQR
ncbi:hypothetical protein C1H76_6538 [Elsinoe australis]|uniref:Altered inheritance of mitochondria protein 9, mitochondrial n=1 Tax=Elsinoe australis TaxID=40998 RepID=A0A4U7B0B2_9PEZI|nr:hypothetical protein C1H76_6538 [Elsinoe australis]